MDGEEFGQYLRRLRKEKKLTVRQLDLYSTVSHSYISQMERGIKGIPSPEILQKLAKPLGVQYEELMSKAGYITVFDNEKYIHEGRIGKEHSEDRKMFLEEVFEDFDKLPEDEQKRVHKVIKAFLSDLKDA